MSSNLKVLVADDNRDHVQLITEILNQELKAEVEGVTTGEECLKKVDQARYDLLLLDYLFPKISGLDVLKKIVEKGYDLPVVMITGHGNEKVAVEAMKAGAIDYIVKSEDGFDALPSVAKKTIEKSRLKKELKESEEKIRTILESSPDAITVTDLQGNVIEYNQATLDVHGFSAKEEVIGKNALDFIAAKDHEKARENTEKTLKQGSVKDVEYTVLTKDGREFPAELSASVIRDSSGKPTSFVAITKDITERKRAEEALRKSERQASTAIEAARALTFRYDIATGKIDWGGAIEEITGYTREEFAKVDIQEWADRIHPHDRDEILSILQEAMEKDRATAEYRFKTKKGYVILSSISLTEKQDGKAVRLVGILQDITERKQAEEALQRSFSELSSLFDGLPLGVAYLSPNLRFVRVNKTLEAIIGHKEEQLLGKFCYDVIGEHAQDPTKKGKEKICSFCKTIEALKEGRIEEIERPLGDKTLQVISSPIKDAKGEVTGVMELAEDISEKKKMEAQLIQAERLSAVGTLAYGIAHEFNNILAGILGNAEFGMGNDDPKQVKECFRIIMESCDRAKGITNSLLAFSRQREAKKQRADITETVETVLGLVERELEKQNIKVVRKFSPIPEITCDLGELSGVVLNMITNARDAMKPDGGTLTIEIGKRQDNIEMSFTDTGCGIPDSIKSRLFEPFVTTKGALGQSEIPGTGLGLFLSYGIVTRYHGKIGVKSEKGKGSKFTIKIPISKNQVSPDLVEGEEEKRVAVPQNLNILLVDDEESICTAIKKFFEAKGVSVTTALSGKKGFEIFKKGSFDLVLADITMPDMDGVELISKLKKIDQQVKFIVLTGHIAEDKLESAKKAGADQILMKPFRNEELYQVVGRVLSI